MNMYISMGFEPMTSCTGIPSGLGIRSERIARFLSKNERMSDILKKMSDSLIGSFLLSDLSDLLTIAHFL